MCLDCVPQEDEMRMYEKWTRLMSEMGMVRSWGKGNRHE